MTRTRTIPRFLHQLQVAVHQRVSEDGTAVEIYERVYTAVDARKNVGYHSAQQIPPPLVVSLEPDQQIGVVIVDQDEREMRHPANHPARKHQHQSFCAFRVGVQSDSTFDFLHDDEDDDGVEGTGNNNGNDEHADGSAQVEQGVLPESGTIRKIATH